MLTLASLHSRSPQIIQLATGSLKFKPVIIANGFVLGILGLSMLPSWLLSYLYREPQHAHFLIPIILLLLLGLLARLSYRNIPVMSSREAILMVALAWVMASACGALPFIISGTIPDFSSAFFESLSGFTATGSTVLADIEAVPHSVLFWRSETHWLGGMGIVVLAIAILPALQRQRNLFSAEAPTALGEEQVFKRVAITAKSFWKVYLALSAAQFLALLPVMNWFDALTHTFSTIAGGGFSTRNASIAAFDSVYVELVVMLFMLAGATSFILHYQLLHGKIRYFRNKSFLAFMAVILFSIAAISLNRYGITEHESLAHIVREASFQVVSVITTTGFATTDFKFWPAMSMLVLLVLMFVGGMPASTSGSIKITRYLILFKEFRHTLYKMISPRSVAPIMVARREIKAETIISVKIFMLSYLAIFVISSGLLTAFGHSAATSFSAVAATLGNVGPGIDQVGPFDNFSVFSAPEKWLLSADMLLGRLEIWSFLAIFTTDFWRS